MKVSSFSGKRVVLIGAHPDDCVFRAGGTIADLVSAGAEITPVVVTGGSSGKTRIAIEDGHLSALRLIEEQDAMRVLGVEADVIHLGFQDANLLDNPALLREQLLKVVRGTRPDLIISYNPDNRTDSVEGLVHPDHFAVANALFDVVYPHSNSVDIYSAEQFGSPLQQTPELWVFGINANQVRHPNRVKISRSSRKKKMLALACYKSQDEQRLIRTATRVGRREGRYSFAEGFTVLNVEKFGE